MDAHWDLDRHRVVRGESKGTASHVSLESQVQRPVPGLQVSDRGALASGAQGWAKGARPRIEGMA